LKKNFSQVKRAAGSVTPPSSYTMLLKTACLALFAEGRTEIQSIPKCHASEGLLQFLQRTFGNIERQGDAVTVNGKGNFADPALPAEIELSGQAEVLETLTPLFFKKGVRFKGGREALTQAFLKGLKKLDAAGFSYQLSRGENDFSLDILTSSPDSVEIELDGVSDVAKTLCLFALASAATGKNRIIELVPQNTESEAVLQRMGGRLSVTRKGGPADEDPENGQAPDELEKRIKRLQAKREQAAGEKSVKIIQVDGVNKLAGGHVALLGDPLLAAPFLLAGALFHHSRVSVSGVEGGAQGGFLHVLRRMGAQLQAERAKDGSLDLTVESSKLAGRRISGEATAAIGDMLPFLAVAAAYAAGQTVIRDALFLREGLTDVLEGTVRNLKAMGVKVGEIEDGIVIEGAKAYDGAEFDSYGHPAVAMAFSVAAAKSRGQSVLNNAEAVDRIWPDFYFQFEKILEQDK
jgi:5-enolpyruvylshikimate-3-phosphate synthase